MVIITTIVAKIYFPESLQGNRVATAGGGGDLARNYSFRRKQEDKEQDSNSEDYYGSDGEEDEDGEDEDDVLDSGEEDNNENDNDANSEHVEETDLFLGNPKSSRNKKRRYNFLEFDQDRMSRTQVFQRLVFCSLMLNITFVAWGVLQVRSSLLLCELFHIHVEKGPEASPFFCCRLPHPTPNPTRNAC
jgi:hypothetical protein